MIDNVPQNGRFNVSQTKGNNNKIRLADGRSLGYSEYGDPAGKPVVYCHGGFSSRLDVSWANKICQDQKVRLLAVDRPGIGISDRKPRRTLLDWAEDVRQLANNLRIQRFPVLGWSLGGPYALVCGYALPELVTAVGTVGGLGPPDPVSISELGMPEDRLLLRCPPQLAWLPALALQAMSLLPAATVKQSLLSHLTARSDHEIVEQLSLADSTDFFYESIRQGGNGVMDDYIAGGQKWAFSTSDIKTKVFLWAGMDDNLCPISVPRRYAPSLVNGQLIELQDRGHFLMHRELPDILDTLLSC